MIKSVSRCRNGAGEQTGGLTVTDQEVIECLATDFCSKHYQVPRGHIEKAFQLAKQELGDSMNAYYAVQTLLVNMLRDGSRPIWKISKETEKSMRKIIAGE